VSDLVLSLFPGLELLDRAFREQGFCVVAGPDRLLGGDVRNFHAPSGRFDGVIGGSPCQSFSSLANLVRAKGLEPRFGNLVPEFERVVVEVAPAWFLHENVPRAPIPYPAGYAVRDFIVCNSSIEGEDGLGQEQERVRRFTFGVRGPGPAPNLLRWIPRAALRLPAQLRSGAVLLEPVDNSPGAKGRTRQPAAAYDDGPGTRERLRVQAVVADPGSETRPARVRTPPLTGENGTKYETRRARVGTVSRDDTRGHRDKANGWGSPRRTLQDMLRLQGLPEDLLGDQPFTAKAARRMVANGVPLPLGRAVAQAVRVALDEMAAACICRSFHADTGEHVDDCPMAADVDDPLLRWRDAEISEMTAA
jgi:site-specific DNA-cytosine methylase